MSNLVLLAVSLLIGIGLQHIKNIPRDTHLTLGALIIHVPLPALCLLTLPDLDWNPSLISLVLVTWIIFGMAFLIFPFIGKKLNWDKALIGCLIFTAGFCNSSFVGLPVIESLFGQEALKHAILLDQSGSFLIVATFGIWVALSYSSGKMSKRILLKKILLFPPFLGFLAGTLAGFFGWRAEGVSREVLQRLAALLTPLALMTVGLQLHWNGIKEEIRYLTLGLIFKLLIAPLVIITTYSFFGVDDNLMKVAVMEAGMAPMITSSILAATHNLRPRLASMMVGVGVPLSFITLSFWYWVLSL